MRCEQTFTTDDFRESKQAIKINKGFLVHAVSKEHLACCRTSKEKTERSQMG